MERQRHARAPGTVRNSNSGISVYLAFCHRIGIDYLHPSYQEICTFIEYMVKYSPAPSTIKNKISQIRVFITLSEGSISGFVHPRTARAIDAIEKDMSYIPRIKQPLSSDFLVDILVHLHNTQTGSVVRAAILLLYYGALRQGELLPRTVKTWSPRIQPTRDDCIIQHDYISLYIKTGKNLQPVGQYRHVTLQKADSAHICPVTSIKTVLSFTPTISGRKPLLMFPNDRALLTSTYVAKQLQ